MKKNVPPAGLSRTYESERQIELDHQLARIRIYYTIFCLATVFIASKYLKISPTIILLFFSAALFYSLVRFFKPARAPANKHLPPAIDWLDLLFIAFLIHLTGGVRSFFYVAYTLPICGSIIRFGAKAGLIGYIATLGLTGLIYLLNIGSPSAPPLFYILAGAGTLAFTAWMVSLLAKKEAALRNKICLSSVTDHLTGLYNSNYLRSRIKEEIERCRRENLEFALSFIDLDNFRFVNDRYGHLVGDKVLKQVADIFSENTRKSDVFARYGGDEFVLLMPRTGHAQIEMAMQRIEAVVNASTFTKNIKISLSSGMAIFPTDGDSLDKLLTVADTRMYKKKRKEKGSNT